MDSLSDELEDLLWDMMTEQLVQQQFDLSNLEKRMKSRFPGNYRLILASRSSRTVIPVRVVFDDVYDKTEWMMKWG